MLPLLQAAANAAPHPMSGTVAQYLWLVPVFPLLGFVINGFFSLTTAFHKGPKDPSASQSAAR